MTTAEFISDMCWLGRRVFIVALAVGQFWNGGPPAQRASVFMLVLGIVLLVGWVRSCRTLVRRGMAG